MQKTKIFLYLKKPLTNIALILFSAVIMILMIELFFLLFPGTVPDSVEHLTRARIYNYDSELYGIPKPNLNKDIYLNSLNKTITIKTVSHGLKGIGFRDNIDELKADKRILILGDSFIFGYGVSNNYTIAHYLGEILKKNKFDVDVINGGVTGYSSKLELAYYKRFGRKLNPDIVIVALWENDFKDNYVYEHARFLIIRAWFGRHSMLYNLGAKFIGNLKGAKNNQYNITSKKKIPFELESERIKEGYRIERENLVELSKLVEEDGGIMVLLILPGSQNIHISQLYKKSDNFILMDLSAETPKIPDLIQPSHGHYTEDSAKKVAELIYSAILKKPKIIRSLKDFIKN